MKVLMINGSPHVKGNTKVALEEMVKIFHEEGSRQRFLISETKTSGDVLPVIHVWKKENAFLMIL